uniref:Titin n=1 Tax=Astatotilapia calliptera TaxID=8154 RepID=A0AAX7U1G9_ASTCA
MVGIPLPTAKWMTDGKEITSEGRYHIQSAESTTTLSIPECQRADTGEYILTVSNPAGSKTVALHVTVLDLPGPPIGPINILEVTPDYMMIQWRAPKDDGGTPITNYVVEKKDVKKPWEVPGLIEGLEYRLRIRATNKVGDSEPKELPQTILAKDILVPPEIVVDVSCRDSVTVRAGQIISLITRVKGRPDPEITWTKDARALARDKRTQMNNNYPLCELIINDAVRSDYGKYAIVAKNSSGQAQAAIVVNVLDTPGACQNIKVAYVTKKSCMVSWENPEDNGGTEITQYIIECRQPSQRGWTVVSNDCTNAENKIGTGPPTETKTPVLAFRVQTKNEGGESNWVTTAEVMVKEQLVIPEIKIKLDGTLIVKAGGSIPIEATVTGKPQPDIKWTRDESTEEIKKGPRLQIESGADFSKLLITGARRTDSGKYAVTASNNAGTCSAHAKVIVLDRPGPIRDLKISGITNDRCHLAWEIPEDDGGCDIYNYIIEKCETKRGVWSVHSNAVITNKAKVTRLIEGNEYMFRVRAENKMGSGPAVQSEAIVAGTQFSVPGAPEAPEVIKIAKEEMTVQWSEPEKDGGKPITGYLLEKKEEHAVKWSPVNKDPIPGTRFTVTGLLPLHEYQYRVKAVNEIGISNPSKASRAITAKDAVGMLLVIILNGYTNRSSLITEPPAPPTNLKVVDSTKSTVTLGWTKPVSDGGAPIIGYVVEMRAKGSVKKGEDGWKRCNVAAQLIICEFTVTSLDENLVYEFRVSAQNQVGMSLPCNLEGAVIPREILGEDVIEFNYNSRKV